VMQLNSSFLTEVSYVFLYNPFDAELLARV
jgi:hypothetical protein